MHQAQAFAHRHANMIGKFNGRCASAAFTAINNDKVRVNICGQHRLGNAEPLPRMADTKLEANWFSAGQITQLFNKMHQF